jgi:glycosyltransferase involved in cell wall biosynthesis
MKVTFVATVFNEEKNIKPLLESLFSQSKFPDEIIIVDGGSTDNTVSEISSFKFPESGSNAKIKLLFKKGNISVGRNEAIKSANNEIIVCSDAGCILDKDWIKNIIKPFENKNVDVVAGYYKGNAKTIFQKCLVPYVLVMPDKADVNNFLPATRSMAFKKSIWKKMGEFDEKISYSEDYAFAKKLKKNKANIVFEKKAVVSWMPRDNFGSAFLMFYRFAKGDAESRILRPKVVLIFLRYLIGLFLIIFYITFKSQVILNILYLMLFLYILWSIIKNYKYVKKIGAILFLLLLQIESDIAVMLGTIRGLFSFVNFN